MSAARDPGMAMLLSVLFPAGGQLYARDIFSAFTFIHAYNLALGWLALVLYFDLGRPVTLVIGAVVAVGVWIFSAVDARRVVQENNRVLTMVARVQHSGRGRRPSRQLE